MKVSFLWTQVIMLMCRLISLHYVTPTADAQLVRNPRIDVKLCGRGGRPSWICDPYQILNKVDADKLDYALDDLRRSTPCHCGVERTCNTTIRGYTVSIAILPYLPSARQEPVTVRNYADYLRKRAWRFGKCNDDIVIVVSKKERKVYASAGPTAALRFKSRVANDIYDDTRQFFDNDDFYTGLLVMVERIREVFLDTYDITPDFPVWPVVQMTIGALFVLICFCSMYLCRKLYQ